MKCPYSGDECIRCKDACELDQYRGGRGKIVIDLTGVTFTCECGAIIRTPVHPCGMEGCRFKE